MCELPVCCKGLLQKVGKNSEKVLFHLPTSALLSQGQVEGHRAAKYVGAAWQAVKSVIAAHLFWKKINGKSSYIWFFTLRYLRAWRSRILVRQKSRRALSDHRQSTLIALKPANLKKKVERDKKWPMVSLRVRRKFYEKSRIPERKGGKQGGGEVPWPSSSPPGQVITS